MNAVVAVARYALLEARRSRLLWLAAAFLLAGFVLAEFVTEVALTEVSAFQSSLFSAVLRLSAVFILSLYVATSMVREFNDKVHELVLAAEVPRWSYFCGKLLGYCVVAVIVAALYGVALLLYVPPGAAAIWAVSLACELAIMVSACLLALFTFGQVTAALSTVFGFYLLARSIAAIQLMSDSPLLASSSMAQQALRMMVDGVAFALPELHRFTSSDWLTRADGATLSVLLPVLGQTAIYLPLLGAAALFDLYRRNL